MNLPSVSTQATLSVRQDSTDDRRLHGRWLILARAVWFTLVIFTLGIFFASLPVYLAQLQTPCAGTTCGSSPLCVQAEGRSDQAGGQS